MGKCLIKAKLTLAILPKPRSQFNWNYAGGGKPSSRLLMPICLQHLVSLNPKGIQETSYQNIFIFVLHWNVKRRHLEVAELSQGLNQGQYCFSDFRKQYWPKQEYAW